MNVLEQIATVTLLGLRNIPHRLGASLVVIVGMACVVGVFISILSLQTGYMETIDKTGRADRAVALSQGAQFEFASALPRDVTLKTKPARRLLPRLPRKPQLKPRAACRRRAHCSMRPAMWSPAGKLPSPARSPGN